ncbi:MAG: glycosyltransferase family 39 protein [Candidatus Roizmanbacteria bacterium]|nr:MAG: glycosyltransferase family 39 protein [Candidatus Roizmanbacteria bacterium]
MIFKKNSFPLLLLFCSLIIFFEFTKIPKYLFFDEVEFARLALSLNTIPYTPYSELATGHATLYFYVILIFFKVLGISTFALRLPAAVFGVLCALIFYLIIQRIFHKPYFLALILFFVFVTQRWFFNFARFSFETTFLLFLELTSLYFFFLFKEKKKLIYIILCGLFAGLAFHSYYPGRIFFLLPLVFLIIEQRKYILSYLFIFLLVSSPLIIYLLGHPDKRLDQQLYLKHPKLTVVQKAGLTIENISKTALMFSFKGDMNGRHNYTGKPALNPIIGVFFILGIIVTISNRKNFYNQFFLGYFVISIIPALLTFPSENPNMLRTYTVIPSIIYFIGNAVSYLLKIKRNHLVKILILLFVISAIYEIRTYFMFQSLVFEDDAFKVKKPLEKVVKF